MNAAWDRKQIEGRRGTVLFLRNLPAKSLPYPGRPTHKLRPLRLASFPSRGCCCWRKAGNQGIGLLCTVCCADSLGPLFLWPVVVPYLPRRTFLSDPGRCWAPLPLMGGAGLQPTPGSLLRVTASWSSGDMGGSHRKARYKHKEKLFLAAAPTHSCRFCLCQTLTSQFQH